MVRVANLKKAPRVKKSSLPIRKNKAIANKKPKAAVTSKRSITAVVLPCRANETQLITDLAISYSIANFSSATACTVKHDARHRNYEADLAMAILGPMKYRLEHTLLTLEAGPQGAHIPVLFCVIGGNLSALHIRRQVLLVIFC